MIVLNSLFKKFNTCFGYFLIIALIFNTQVQAAFSIIEKTETSSDMHDNLKIIGSGSEVEKYTDSQIEKLRLENILLKEELARLKQHQEASFKLVNAEGLIFQAKGTRVLISQTELKSLAFNARSARRIMIYGYTDSTGSNELNFKIGKLRAENLKNQLISMGIKASKIETRSLLKNYISSNSTASGRAKNRRVKVYLMY